MSKEKKRYVVTPETVSTPYKNDYFRIVKSNGTSAETILNIFGARIIIDFSEADFEAIAEGIQKYLKDNHHPFKPDSEEQDLLKALAAIVGYAGPDDKDLTYMSSDLQALVDEEIGKLIKRPHDHGC